MMNNRRKFVLPLVITLVLLVGVVMAWATYGPTTLPDEFTTGRVTAGELSQRIVDITASVTSRVEEANQNELGGHREIAEALLQEAHDRNYEARLKALELSDVLAKLSASLSDIGSRDSRTLAYQSISIELSLVAQYLKYTDSLNRFLELLPATFGSLNPSDQEMVIDALAEVNQRAQAINQLNKAFGDKIREFDKSL
jgi:hypothetical protein